MKLKEKCLTCQKLVLCVLLLGGPETASEAIVALQAKLAETTRPTEAIRVPALEDLIQ